MPQDPEHGWGQGWMQRKLYRIPKLLQPEAGQVEAVEGEVEVEGEVPAEDFPVEDALVFHVRGFSCTYKRERIKTNPCQYSWATINLQDSWERANRVIGCIFLSLTRPTPFSLPDKGASLKP